MISPIKHLNKTRSLLVTGLTWSPVSVTFRRESEESENESELNVEKECYSGGCSMLRPCVSQMSLFGRIICVSSPQTASLRFCK